MKNLYETDFYLWSMEQTDHLKNQRYHLLDLDHLIEEIEDLGKSERRAVKSNLINLITHLLKCEFQKDFKSKSWEDSIKECRRQILIDTEDNPSLNEYPEEILLYCYSKARNFASKETGLDLKTFPLECPWSINEILGNK